MGPQCFLCRRVPCVLRVVRVASSNGGVDTIPVKRWTSYDGKGFGPGYLKDFTTGYTDPQAAYQKIRDLAGEFPNLAQIYNLPNKTNGYQRQSQAMPLPQAMARPQAMPQPQVTAQATARLRLRARPALSWSRNCHGEA